jgi:8-oxo-dGTP diphosphatase
MGEFASERSMQAPVLKPIAVAIAVLENNGKFLVGVRPPNVPLAGLAEFPGGKIDPGETPEDAAIRECQEETGLTVEVVEKYFSTLHQYEHGLLEIHFFRCRPVQTSSAAQPRSPFRWVARREFSKLKFPAANDPLMELLDAEQSASEDRGIQ